MKARARRDFGRNFAEAVTRLQHNIPPQRAGSRSAGIGAAMRAGPLGSLYRDDPTMLMEVAMASSLVTHGDIRAGAIAYAVAHTVAGFVAGRPAEVIAAELPDAVAAVESDWIHGHPEWECDRSDGHAVSIGLAALLGDLVMPADVLRARISKLARPTLAAGFGGAHALAMALLPDIEPQAVLTEIIRQGYDTDTVAAICSSIVGAHCGCGWIPVDRLVDRDRLLAYADALVTRDSLPEDMGCFLAREAELTAEERAFQRRA